MVPSLKTLESRLKRGELLTLTSDSTFSVDNPTNLFISYKDRFHCDLENSSFCSQIEKHSNVGDMKGGDCDLAP